MLSLEQLHTRIKALTIFRSLRENPVMQAFLDMTNKNEEDSDTKIERYARFTHLLFQNSENFTQYLWQLIVFDENIYVRKHAKKEPVSEMLRQTVNYELQTLQSAAQTSSQIIQEKIGATVFLPEWSIDAQADFARMYHERIDHLFSIGYGIYASNIMFTCTKGKIIPVKHADRIRLSTLSGYERQREQVIDNTLAFIEGRPAADTLLYGDAGTGKSSTVKAIVNEFADRGLRMIEVRKGDLLGIPDLIEQLADNPLKFILFIDDLSFSKHNEEIGALKAILEGSVSAKSSNVVIYTTSNRRHLINETFEDRQGSDIHINETIQEQTSLSDRFGLSILFARPAKDEYLDIVHDLMKEYGVAESDNMDLLAERHALERGGRSGRTARQFVESLKRIR